MTSVINIQANLPNHHEPHGAQIPRYKGNSHLDPRWKMKGQTRRAHSDVWFLLILWTYRGVDSVDNELHFRRRNSALNLEHLQVPVVPVQNEHNTHDTLHAKK